MVCVGAFSETHREDTEDWFGRLQPLFRMICGSQATSAGNRNENRFHSPNIAIVPYTSKTPQNDIGNYLSPCSRNWRSMLLAAGFLRFL